MSSRFDSEDGGAGSESEFAPEVQEPEPDRTSSEATDTYEVEGEPPEIVQKWAAHFQSHHGPLPLASEFQGYEEALPGAADRILTMAEAAQAETFRLEHRQLDTDAETLEIAGAALRREQWITAGVAAAALLASILLAYIGYPWPAAAAALGGTTGVLVLGKRILSRERGDGQTDAVGRHQGGASH